jgi:very-short-patch-repair endonuclease
VNREPDFLVCKDGHWGVLEVDGDLYHSRAAKDHERDRLFRACGIKVVERYTANRCYREPEKVVGEFLVLLDKAYAG